MAAADCLNEKDKRFILAFAENNMRWSQAAAVLYLCPQALAYRAQRIKGITGLDPKKFYDLVKLTEIVNDDTGV